MKLLNLHTDLVGKLCKLTEMGVILEKEYHELYGIGSVYTAERLLWWHNQTIEKYRILLMFINEPPMTIYGKTFYCVKEIGNGSNGDWYWFTLDQLMICE